MAKGEIFRDYEVKAESIADFLNRYYRPERYTGRGEEYAATLLQSHQEDFKRDGYDIISHHDSVTGRTVAYFGTLPDPQLSDFELNELFYKLGDGVAWNLQEHLVTFKTQESAKAFKAAAPRWIVQYQAKDLPVMRARLER